MGWLSDAWDAVIDVAEEIPIVNGLVGAGRALEEFVPELVDDIGDALSDPVDTVVDAVVGAAETVGESLAGFGALLLSPVAIAGDIIGGVTEFAGEALDTVTFGGASWVMDAVDDYVFDSVDYVTGGAIDIDFDDGAFSFDLGMNELASVGFSIGENGFTADGYVAGLGAGVGATKDDGFTVDLKADLPFLDEAGVGVGLGLGDGDDAFFLDFDGRVLGGDDEPALSETQSGFETGPGDATGEVDVATQVLAVPRIAQFAPGLQPGVDTSQALVDEHSMVRADPDDGGGIFDGAVLSANAAQGDLVAAPAEAVPPAPEPADDFARELAGTDQLEDAAGALWDDLG